MRSSPKGKKIAPSKLEKGGKNNKSCQKTTGQITGPRNTGHGDLQKYEVTRSVKRNKYSKYDAFLLTRARDIRQNHWTL